MKPRRRPKKPTPCAYRLLEPLDVPDMVPMLAAWQQQCAAEVGYPWVSERTPFEMGAAIDQEIRHNPTYLHIGAVVNYHRDANRRVLDGKVKGFILARVLQRSVGEPRLFVLVELLCVDPAFRARKIAPRLIYALTSLARTRFGVNHVECRYPPGGRAARQMERAGFRPYETTAAFVGVDGSARDELPFDRVSRRARWARFSADQPAAEDKSSPAGPAPPTTT